MNTSIFLKDETNGRIEPFLNVIVKAKDELEMSPWCFPQMGSACENKNFTLTSFHRWL